MSTIYSGWFIPAVLAVASASSWQKTEGVRLICTWDCDDLPQLLFQAHDVFAELNVIHPGGVNMEKKARGGDKKEISIIMPVDTSVSPLLISGEECLT